MKEKTIRIACRGAYALPISELEPYQGDLKDLVEEDFEHAKNAILRLGFSEPIAVWEHEGHNYVLNGHQRLRVLETLQAQGYSVPKIPVSYVEAGSVEEAKQKILSLTSQFGRINKQGLYNFIETSGLEWRDVAETTRFPEVPMPQFVSEYYRDALPGTDAVEEQLEQAQHKFEPKIIAIPEIKQGDCLEVMRSLPENSVDSLVTDPPAGISFMGKEWDDDKGGRREWIGWLTEVMREAKRVMKPGAHALVWAIPRTSHWTATALEEAGFEIRDVITHLFGSGFPKSLAIDKAIDKMNGDERPVIGESTNNRDRSKHNYNSVGNMGSRAVLSSAASAASAAWEGWGTALKPASEHWLLVRKPIAEDSIAANVLKWGVGGLNIDRSRIGTTVETWPESRSFGGFMAAHKGTKTPTESTGTAPAGRFPANLVLTHHEDCEPSPYVTPDGETHPQCHEDCPVRMLDEQSGKLTSGANPTRRGADDVRNAYGSYDGQDECDAPRGLDSGGASRFFYVAKPAKSERNRGLEDGEERVINPACPPGSKGANSPRAGAGRGGAMANFHPTVKPLKLMRYFITMITPPGGLVLDPFCGSGTTGVAAAQCGMRFLGIEREPDYVAIATHRFMHELNETDEEGEPDDEPEQDGEPEDVAEESSA